MNKDGELSQVSSESLEAEEKSEVKNSLKVEEDCELDQDCVIEDSIDTYLKPDVSLPGENKAREELEEAIK